MAMDGPSRVTSASNLRRCPGIGTDEPAWVRHSRSARTGFHPVGAGSVAGYEQSPCPAASRGSTVIDFRYHLVSIVAVFLALAIGIVLGSTELQGPTYNLLNQTTAKLQNELDQTSNQRDAAQHQPNLGENYAQAVQPVVLHNLLEGQRLLIVTEPGAPASVVNAISKAA